MWSAPQQDATSRFLRDSTELNIQGKQLNYDGMPDFDYFKPCGLTPENINSINALNGEEAKALYGEKGSNGAILFGVKGTSSCNS